MAIVYSGTKLTNVYNLRKELYLHPERIGALVQVTYNTEHTSLFVVNNSPFWMQLQYGKRVYNFKPYGGKHEVNIYGCLHFLTVLKTHGPFEYIFYDLMRWTYNFDNYYYWMEKDPDTYYNLTKCP
jgi:hypothetical protein